MALVTLDELKTALGVGDLYPDDVLDDVIQTAESVIEPFLTTHSAGVWCATRTSNIVTIETNRRHYYAVGQSITVTSTDYDGVYTVTGVTDFTFNYTLNGADTVTHFYRPNGKVILTNGANYDNVVAVRTAALMVAMDVWNARTVPGGQAQGIDFVPGPYLMGRSIINRVQGLLEPYRDVSGMVG